MRFNYAILSTLAVSTANCLAVRQVENEGTNSGSYIRIRSSNMDWDGKYVSLKEAQDGVRIAVAATNRGIPSFVNIAGSILYSSSPIVINGASTSTYIGAFSNRNTWGQYVKPLYFIQNDRDPEFAPHLSFSLSNDNTFVSRDTNDSVQSWWVCKSFRPAGMPLDTRLDVVVVSIDPEDPMDTACVRVYLEKV